MQKNRFGKCEYCNGKIVAEWFEDQEYINGIKTGRVRDAVSYLFCEDCFKSYCVDDSFDSIWRN